MTSILLERETVQETDSGAPIVAHIVNCPDNYERTEDYLMEATVLGLEVTALCGHVFIPQHDFKGKQVCEACLDEATQIALLGF